MSFLYTNISGVQRTGYNNPGGGLEADSLGSYNDPVFELGTASEITAVYTMTGAEVQSDIIYIARVGQGVLVDPVRSSITGNGIAGTATMGVGDTDTVDGTQAMDSERYSKPINVAANMVDTTAVSFAGGTTLITPASITDDDNSGGQNGQQVWLTAKFATLSLPQAGKKLVFRIKLADNR